MGVRIFPDAIGVLIPGIFALATLACGGGSNQATTTPLAAAPSGLTAIGSEGQVALSWNALPTATGYKVKRGAHNGPYTQIGASSTTRYADAGRTNGTTYYYVVSAVTSAGETPNSSEVSATPSAGLPVLPDGDPTRNAIGLNVWFLSDWDGGFAFVDAMKHARPWQDGADWHNPVAGIDALGWPTADASTVVNTGTPAQVNGTYIRLEVLAGGFSLRSIAVN